MTHEAPVRLLLAEDQVMIREALAALLAFEGDMEVVAQVGRGDEVVKAAQDTEPDVAVLDARLPDGSGIDVCRELRSSQPSVRCLILTAHDDDDALRAAVIAGDSGAPARRAP